MTAETSPDNSINAGDMPPQEANPETVSEVRRKRFPFVTGTLVKRLVMAAMTVGIVVPTVLCIVLTIQNNKMAIRVDSLEAAFRSGQFSQLSASVANLEKQLAGLEQRFAVKDDVTAEMNTLAEQISAQTDKNEQLSQAMADDRQTLLRQGGQMTTLQSVIDELKTRIPALIDQRERLEKAASVSDRPSAETQKAKRSSAKKSLRSARTVPLAAPFILTGIERRGGQVYAVVAPNGASSLSQMQLLALGDSAWGWTLRSAQGNEAIFSVNGIQQRLTAQ
ncbi:plasmid transfer protein [Acerihabitans arboris]|uniref:Plasmid transfer protein n=1 Tax=Acerihabitans arboris TaxID=2691583 RepID=A0A845SP40_9GAMM|nr:plasmid transfer protein [Acerihabitans arboris]NDL64278.1 plasmid transfer protein [Acerihabitans arboris]